MTDKPSRGFSLRKTAADDTAVDPAATTPAPGSPPPRTARLAAGALVLSGVAALGAALSLMGVKDWLRDSVRDSINDDKKLSAKKRADKLADIPHQVDLTVKSQIIATIVVLLAMALVAMAVYKGRPWARWGTVGLWALSTFTGTLSGLVSVASIAADQPMQFKLPAFASGVLFVAAVVLVNLRPSVAYFNSNKPDPGSRPQRRGLFAPREPAGSGGSGGSAGKPTGRSATGNRTPARSAATSTSAGKPADRSRTKQRASADAVAKGADLARSRAKASSKSRRTGT